MKQKTLGLIGGLGPETGCNFCLSVNNKFKHSTQRQPHILLDNLPISQDAETILINGGESQEHLELLLESVRRLNRLNADIIAIACNTVHVFIDKLRKKSSVPILSIIEETAKKCKELNFSKVGILGSTTTINSELHSKELKRLNIDSIIPSDTDQQFISECIIRIINHRTKRDDKDILLRIIKNLESDGAQSIILGCTDLPILFSNKDLNIPIVNTMQILEDAVVRTLIDAK